MKILFRILSILTICIFLTNLSNATVFTSKQGGNFNDPATWDEGGQIPGEMDDVIIQHAVFINLTNKQTVKSLSLKNNVGFPVGLMVQGGDSLIILNNLDATLSDNLGGLYLNVIDSTSLIVNGDVNFQRITGNVTDFKLKMTLSGNSKTIFKRNFNFEYKGSGLYELNREIEINQHALLEVIGETKFINTAGEDFNFVMHNESQAIFHDSLTMILTGGGEENGITLHDKSSLQIFSSAYLFSSAAATTDYAKLRARNTSDIYIKENVYLETQGGQVQLKAEEAGGKITVGDDIIINASGEKEAYIEILGNGELYLGGNIIRQTDYGVLNMMDDGTLILNGSIPQSIPESNLPNSGNDSLLFGKVKFENTSSSPIVLVEDMVIEDSLILKSGKIQSSETAKVILKDSASISGGSSTSYIMGPVQKQGRTGGVPLRIPVGSSTAYAPITISAISSESSDVTVQYYSEPPPFGVEALETGIDNVSTSGYWNVDRNASTGNVNLTLTWEDSTAAGISEPDDLIVAGWNGTEWENFGQQSSGTDGTGGYVTSLNSEPPPFGVEAFVIGSSTSRNSLPVELKMFKAKPQSDRVYLEWQTESEINASHFVVERSTDGTYFERFEIVKCKGGESTAAQYFTNDLSPTNGFNYYRLKIVDKDDSFEYSNIEVIKFEEDAPVNLYPNPVNHMLHIKAYEWQEEEVMMEIFDRNGSRVFVEMIAFEDGYFEIPTDQINVTSWGTYIVRITGKTQSKVVKFVKAQ